MASGRVEGIYIAYKKGGPTILVEHVHVVPGMGIEGDRYFGQKDLPSRHAKSGRQITLIELEVIESMSQDDGIQISADQTRRNIITSGIALNALVDSLFSIGSVQLHGVRLCEPCQYLANRTDPRILTSMAHRGGLRAEIISEGTIHINDLITVSAA